LKVILNRYILLKLTGGQFESSKLKNQTVRQAHRGEQSRANAKLKIAARKLLILI
jgi:hypothetical protein